MTSPVVASLVTDLDAERASLLGVLDGLTPDQWHLATPAPGWTIHDQVAHLAYFDAVTRLAVEDPAAFAVFRDGLVDLQTAVDAVGPDNRHRDAAAMLAWWREEHAALTAAFLAADPAVRVLWFGPPMSLASKVTARLMETWAHGQDVVDAVGARREPTDRLRHVARIGVLALPNSFVARGLEVPTTPVRVSLTAPDGASTWDWGPAEATDVVSGTALDFCLVVTQRRHLADTALIVSGRTARAWMDVAQAFAGPAGPGRRPGQFASGR